MSASTYSSALSKYSLETLTSLGNTIKRERSARGWSQEFARQRFSMSKHTLGLIEKGSPNVGIGAYLAALDSMDITVRMEFVDCQASQSPGER